MKEEVLLVGDDLSQLIDISLSLNLGTFSTLIAEHPAPLDYMLSETRYSSAGVVLYLRGTENVADLNALFDAYPDTAFVFLAPQFPASRRRRARRCPSRRLHPAPRGKPDRNRRQSYRAAVSEATCLSLVMTESRPNPDALLAKLKREHPGRGRLRIYLGAFPGVGKTYAMLNEAQRRVVYNEDVVVGFVETHGRRGTELQLEGLTVIPRKRVEYHGVAIEEMDVEAVLRRHPAVCLVDELAHTNAPGSDREKRYEDVEVLLNAGIDVVSTLNVQHLESLNDTVESLTGVRVRETLPDSVLDEADEVILIDLSPEGARARMAHGHIYAPEQARQALESYFRPENLVALRELALRRTASEVDAQLDEYMREAAHRPEVEDRVLVLIDETAFSRTLIRHAWRLAQAFKGELLVAYIRQPDLTEPKQRELAKSLDLAEDLNAQIVTLDAPGGALSIASFLLAEGVNHVVLPGIKRGLLARLLRPSMAELILANTTNVELHLVSQSVAG